MNWSEIPELVTTEEAAAILGVTPARVRQLVAAGVLVPLSRTTKPLRFWDVDVSDLEYTRRKDAPNRDA